MTVDEMVVYAFSVVRGTTHALVICDMPFGLYTNQAQGVENAVKIMQRTGCDALKLEGGCVIADTVRHIIDMGIKLCDEVAVKPLNFNFLLAKVE